MPFSLGAKLIHKKFMMYIFSYSFVQNGLVFFKCMYIYMYRDDVCIVGFPAA